MKKILPNLRYLALKYGFLLLILSVQAFSTNASEHEHSPNHISLFIGHTDFSEHGNGETVGIDYEYRVSPLLGLGSVVEYAFGSLDALTVLAVADIHLTDQFIIQVGPGYEYTSEHEFFVSRLGALYEFRYSGYTFSPQFHFDYHEGVGSSKVAGLAVGFDF
tara:strand:+ start:773 stop:1258 length:486 start_codon:yes stop_codon:yes gene_type:complete